MVERRRHLEQLLSVGFLFSSERCVHSLLFSSERCMLIWLVVVHEKPAHITGFIELGVVLGVDFPIVLDERQVLELFPLEGIGASIPVAQLIAAGSIEFSSNETWRSVRTSRVSGSRHRKPILPDALSPM